LLSVLGFSDASDAVRHRFVPASHEKSADKQKEREMSEFGRLLTTEIPALRRYSRKLTRDPVEAEDLLQSCLLRALVKERLWQPGTDLRRWLFTMLYHQRVSALRRQARERGLGEAVRVLAAPDAGDANGRLLAAEMSRAIAALPAGQREVVRHVAVGGMGYAEAAAVLAVPEGTVRSRLSRARLALRKCFEDGAEIGEQVAFAEPACVEAGAVGRLAA
jgi:RNA polymerase sigma-70 factor (ECF subfamily)